MANPVTVWAEQAPPSSTPTEMTTVATPREDWTLINRMGGRRHEIARLNKNTLSSMDGTGYGYTIAELIVTGPDYTRIP